MIVTARTEIAQTDKESAFQAYRRRKEVQPKEQAIHTAFQLAVC